MAKLGALWKKEGRDFMTGLLEIDGKKYRITVFPVKEKKSDKSPDYDIVESKLKSVDKPEAQGDNPFNDKLIPF